MSSYIGIFFITTKLAYRMMEKSNRREGFERKVDGQEDLFQDNVIKLEFFERNKNNFEWAISIEKKYEKSIQKE